MGLLDRFQQIKPTTLTLGLTLLVIAGCSRHEEPVRSIDDFIADPDATDAKLLYCRNDRRAAVNDAECSHARTAASRLAIADERAEFEKLKKEAASELSALRAERARLENARDARQTSLRRSAERKLASGQTLTADEALAIGVDPNGSLLVEGERQTPVQNDSPPRQPTPVRRVDPADATRSLEEIREALRADGDDPPANPSPTDDD
ncbi:MAG: EexN family lipoprotein [Woeseiaceae bacterium]